MAKRHRKPKPKRRLTAKLVAVAVLLGIAYGGYLGWTVTREFEQRGWDVPAQVYAASLELYPGRRMEPRELELELERLGYREAASLHRPGAYRRSAAAVEIFTRAFVTPDGQVGERRVAVSFAGGRVAGVRTSGGSEIPILELDPLLIGSIFPAHGEDRIIVTPEEVPPLLGEAIKAVEDRRFDSHFGLDLRAIARAGLVNLRHGEIRQGGSTLTQQLVRSYFLSTERTWSRKLREAFMAVSLELQHDKDALLHAYINEVYLAQDGARAIHGFGLGSRFFFGKPLSELEPHELALLIAQVRGPSFYDPRRHPERARERRDFVLSRMRDSGLISPDQYASATSRKLGIVTGAGGRSSYYAGFLDLVRRQLRRDYAAEDLQATGLKVFTSLDPSVQSAAEAALISELDDLQAGRPELEAALVVTNPHNAEIRALVGGKRTGYDGFNRALDARRQVGSLIKPAVYLAAIESNSQTLASLVEDQPIQVPLDDGTEWSPRNFNDESHGTVTAVRALAESMNMATVRIGIEVGVEAVADVLQRLGLDEAPPAFPSLLLGALDLSPLEVTQVYNTIANGGFRMPLRTVRAVVSADGDTLNRYRIEIDQASDPASIYALNQALVQVMRRGTGRGAQQRLAPGLTTAGKTGTSDDLRDSWFAGFTGDHLVVTWIGNDANEAIGLTGSSGAARIWTRVVSVLDAQPYAAPAPGKVENVWIDYNTGLTTDSRCSEAVALAMEPSDLPPVAAGCGSTRTRLGSRLRRWFRRTID